VSLLEGNDDINWREEGLGEGDACNYAKNQGGKKDYVARRMGQVLGRMGEGRKKITL